jgi:hypothetical protein
VRKREGPTDEGGKRERLARMGSAGSQYGKIRKEKRSVRDRLLDWVRSPVSEESQS